MKATKMLYVNALMEIRDHSLPLVYLLGVNTKLTKRDREYSIKRMLIERETRI